MPSNLSLATLLIFIIDVFISCKAADSRIGGGSDTGGPIDYQVYLRFRSISSGAQYEMCTGTLITPEVVLTAAHCQAVDNDFEVYFDTYDITKREDSKRRSVFDAKTHPQYKEFDLGATRDFQLLLLSEPVPDTIQYILFIDGSPGVDIEINEGDALYATGWGITEFEGTTTSDLLQEAEINADATEQCNEFYSDAGRDLVGPNEFCTRTAGRGVCPGDSGGPIIRRSNSSIADACEDVLVGVVSFGSGCTKGWPDVHGRVSNIFDWIKSTLCEDWSGRASSIYCPFPTTIAPTVSSPPTAIPCVDTPGFVDKFGDDCTWYENNDAPGCPDWINCAPADCDAGFGTPAEACCYCGGGSFYSAAPTIIEPSASPSVSLHPTRTASDPPTVVPTKSSAPTAYCEDYPGWVDKFDETCEYYEENDEPGCPKFKDCTLCSSGMTPGEACCYCGGGILPNQPPPSEAPSVVCVDVPGFVDSFGDDCSYFEKNDVEGCPTFGSCCRGDFGTPNEGCCWCGGGITGEFPSLSPTIDAPSVSPTEFLSDSPSRSPTRSPYPVRAPTLPNICAAKNPTVDPETNSPSTGELSGSPSKAPVSTAQTGRPSGLPSITLTKSPTGAPLVITTSPTDTSSGSPTGIPSKEPVNKVETESPSSLPSVSVDSTSPTNNNPTVTSSDIPTSSPSSSQPMHIFGLPSSIPTTKPSESFGEASIYMSRKCFYFMCFSVFFHIIAA